MLILAIYTTQESELIAPPTPQARALIVIGSINPAPYAALELAPALRFDLHASYASALFYSISDP